MNNKTLMLLVGCGAAGAIAGIFKALARSIKMAVKRDIYKFQLPSSKGML